MHNVRLVNPEEGIVSPCDSRPIALDLHLVDKIIKTQIEEFIKTWKLSKLEVTVLEQHLNSIVSVTCGEQRLKIAHEKKRRYYLDGCEIDLNSFFEENSYEFSSEEMVKIMRMQSGDEIVLGGGAAPQFILRKG